jgi:hypothetical protein
MALNKTYPPDFERLYRVWPSYPKGRTKKHLAAKAFAKAKKEFELTPSDIDEMVLLIDRMKKDRKSWQRGNKFGPQGLQVWLNQAGWQDDYEKVNRVHYEKASVESQPETAEQIAKKLAEQNARFEQARQQAELREEMKRLGIH